MKRITRKKVVRFVFLMEFRDIQGGKCIIFRGKLLRLFPPTPPFSQLK